ncbi:MAG: hypothetical protein AAFP70_04330 [Calditrichota bacterium]
MLKRFWLVLLAALLILSGCEEELGPEGPEPEAISVTAVNVPGLLNLGSPRFYTIAYSVTHPEGVSAISGVTLNVFAADMTTVLQTLELFDDGGNMNPDAQDVIAGDGVYTNRLFSDPQVFSAGDVLIRATATTDGEQVSSSFANAEAVDNSEPVIANAILPDSLRSGENIALSVEVSDPDELSNISTVEVRLQNLSGSTLRTLALNLQAGGTLTTGTYIGTIDSSFAAERQGDFQLTYQAEDLVGAFSNVISGPIYLENLAPFLTNVQLADTIQLPATGQDTLVVRVQANDPQGLSDLEAVEVTVQRVGGTATVIEMFDNGDFTGTRDEVAGDGIYSRGLVLSQSSTAGKFFFTFEGSDKVTNVSAAVVDSLVILP